MIYVAFGTHERPFHRLAQEMERLIKDGLIKEVVIAQTGFTEQPVGGAVCRRFFSPNEVEENIRKCDVFVTHAGAGSCITALRMGKPAVIVPRRKSFGEHSDDHQLQIAGEMKKYGAIIVEDIKDLWPSIERARKTEMKKVESGESPALRMIRGALDKWS